MYTSLESSGINASQELPLHRRFNLTIIFVIGSVLLLIAAGFAADYTGRRIGEASTIRIGTELAESNATLIGNSFSRVLSSLSGDSFNSPRGDGQESGTIDLDPASSSADPLVSFLLLIGDNDLETLFSWTDFQHIGVLSASGGHIWSLGSKAGLSDRDVPVLMASAQGQKSTMLRAKELGALDFMVKPWDQGELEWRVANCLNCSMSMRSVM